MKKILLLVVLVASPALAQNQSQRGLATQPKEPSVEERLAKLERLFNANAVKPCKDAGPSFGCRTEGTK